LMEAATSAWRAVCLTARLVQSVCACSYLPAAKRQELL
jgi:hypothetical protein